jgi:hypothetical protein
MPRRVRAGPRKQIAHELEAESTLGQRGHQQPIPETVNRIKMIKRQMFGRAKLDLLRKRILNRP